jgi:hypothetical protein
MSVEFKVKAGSAFFKAPEKVGQKLAEAEAIFGEIGFFLTNAVENRSRKKSTNVHGQSFPKYSDSHKKRRKKMGFKTSRVDLTMHGDMWNAIAFEETSQSVRVFFRPNQDRNGVSNALKAFWNNQIKGREFFALSEREQEKIAAMFQAWLEKVMTV